MNCLYNFTFQLYLRIKTIVLILFFAWGTHIAHAQQTCSISGTITGNHSPLTSATVLLKNSALQRTVLSDETGHFIFRQLPAGAYTLQVDAINFQTLQQPVVLTTAQQTSLNLFLIPSLKQLAAVTVRTTNKQEQPADNVISLKQIAMPVTIIDRKTIEQMGSRRLDEVLREQTGLAVISDLGAGNRSVGLQMQGFSSEYITILIDGQPMVGRVDGNFDLSRISISGIEKIEIIKGASSSLYGSEALGGVINIITDQNCPQAKALINVLHGTNQTTDVSAEAETPFSKKKGAAFISGDYYQTGGFNVNPYLLEGQTAPPYNNFSLQGRARYKLNDVSTINFSGRYSDRYSAMTQNFGAKPIRDILDERDLNAMAALDNHLKDGTRLIARYYLTRYSSLQNVALTQNGSQLESNNFIQYVHRVEVQASRDALNKSLSLIGGAGGEYQAINAQTQGEGGSMYDYFAYAQGNWKPFRSFNFIGGLRYDGNNLYGGKLNPSVGVSYTPRKWLTLKTSMGKGFKTPSYAQMYQVFTNLIAGYTVVGANTFTQSIQTLKNAGQVEQVWSNASQIQNLKAETSTSYDVGFCITPFKKLEVTANGFYNNINHLINSEQIGIKINGAPLFSYVNVGHAFTAGLETGIQWRPLTGLTVSADYQLLYAKDKAVIDSIKAHSPTYATVRTPTGIRASTVKDYFGLPDRSRHMANLQLFYTYQPLGLSASFRISYRSKYGFMDTDNNGFIDPYDVYVKGYCLLNAAVQKKILKERLTLQLTVNNIANYTDYLMPAQPGRVILAGIAWQFSKAHS